MKALLQSFLGSLRRRGEAGQALYILAVGFIALIGFVGIVTDVSLLFIRYSTLRRAVDAAAIAAAGQMRRVEDPAGTPAGVAAGDATSVANLNIAARQFIEVYGLNPTNVIVETCRTQNVPLATFTIGSPARTVFAPLDRNSTPIFIHNATTGQNLGLNIPIAEGGATIPAGTTATVPATPGRNANRDDVRSYTQLCTADELKLVRVTAQIEAPTVFMRLLGYDTVTLTETAISQTAVIDVVLVMDVSESS